MSADSGPPASPHAVGAPPVALVTFADPDGSGGVPRTVRHLRDGLRERGHDVTVLSRPLARGVRSTVTRRIWRRVDRSSEEVHRIRGALRELGSGIDATPRATVCIAFEAWTAAICARAGRRTLYRVAGLGSITDEWVRNGYVDAASRHVPWLRALERQGFAGAWRVIVLSAAGRMAIDGLGAEPERVVVVPNGIAVGPAPPHGAREGGRLTVLSVANLRHVKGVDVLARALAALPDGLRGGVRLLHVGDGNAPGNPTFEQARDALVTAGVEHEFRGAVPSEGVAAALATADVFVLPSRVEMFPNALLEAMAAGLPAIGTDVGAVPEILGPGGREAGVIVPPDDAAALRDALALVLHDADLRRRLAAANRERVASAYALERTLGRYSELVREAAAS